MLLVLVGASPSARAQMAAAVARAQMASAVATPTPDAAASFAPPAAEAPGFPAGPPSETPSFLELAERLRALGSFSECTVEALRYGYDRPAERERGFERAALCLSLAGRHDDARRLMLTLPSEGTPLGGRDRLRICLAEVFLPDLDAPACAALEPITPRDRSDELAHETLLMRKIYARHWGAARSAVSAIPPAPAQQSSEYDFAIERPSAYDFTQDPTVAAWSQQDRELIRRHDALARKSPLLAGALSAVVPGLGRVYIGRWPDGLLSFLLVGTTGALAAQGFYDEGRGSVRGWILTGVAALLYAGNIYGSAVGAVVQRRDAEDALMQEVDRAYQRRLDP
jgi:TM2 domain-containing membrane protein YozV